MSQEIIAVIVSSLFIFLICGYVIYDFKNQTRFVEFKQDDLTISLRASLINTVRKGSDGKVIVSWSNSTENTIWIVDDSYEEVIKKVHKAVEGN